MSRSGHPHDRLLALASVLLIVLAATVGAPRVKAEAGNTGERQTERADKPETNRSPRSEARLPRPNEASGVAVPRHRDRHTTVNSLLALPRRAVLILFAGPRFAAGEVDDYLESKAANVRNVGADKSAWRFGGLVDWQQSVGPSLALRVGYAQSHHLVVDAVGGLFSARGQSAGLRLAFGRISPVRIEPVLRLELGRSLDRRFAGIGANEGAAGDPHASGPLADYEEAAVAVIAEASTSHGDVHLTARARGAGSSVEDDRGEQDVGGLYDADQLRGWGEEQILGAGELEIRYDSRRPAHPWIPRATPSSGLLVRGIAGYSGGESDRSGGFASLHASIETRYLLDLFRGDRVLSFGARARAISADATDVPFTQLPTLGGRDRLRALASGQLRDRSTTFVDVNYEWALGRLSRANLFVESGGVHPSLGELDTDHYRVGFGGGFRLVGGDATDIRIQIAGTADGDVGFFAQIGAL